MELRKKLRHPLLDSKPYALPPLDASAGLLGTRVYIVLFLYNVGVGNDRPVGLVHDFKKLIESPTGVCKLQIGIIINYLPMYGIFAKACTSGCPYGEACHFSHYIRGELSSLALSQTASQVPGASSHKGVTVPSGLPFALFLPSEQKSLSDGHKTQLCKNYGTLQGCRFGDKCYFEHVEEKRKVSGHMLAGSALDRSSQFPTLPTSEQKVVVCKNFQGPEGCHFGDKCHFAHGEMDIVKPNILKGAASQKLEEKFPWRNLSELTPPGLGLAASAFGAISTAKVSIAASLAGLIIGKGGVNAKAISRATGAKLFVKDHESNSKLKNIEMEGSFEQIQQASSLVKELLIYIDAAPLKPGSVGAPHYKTKLCDNFLKGSCTYGNQCRFAHGPDDLRASM